MRRINYFLSVLLCAVLLMGAIAVSATAATETDGEKENTVTVRIEGITENLYFGEVSLSDDTANTVQSVLCALDAAEESMTIVGADAGFITAVNSDGSALTETGWDGWMYRVNGEASSVGISDCTVKAGDSIVLYYSDEYKTGMQYPEMDASDIESGVLRFSSKDTTYDADFNPIVSENPVVGMNVVWNYGDESVTYTTDENGCINIEKEYLTPGDHKVSVARSTDGIPTVLRLAPDTVVTVAKEQGSATAQETPVAEETTAAEETTVAEETSEAGSSAENETNTSDTSKKTSGCKSVAGLAIVPIVALAGIVFVKKKNC